MNDLVQVAELAVSKRHAAAVAFSPDSRWLAAGGMEGVAKVWRTDNWDLEAEMIGHEKSVNGIAFHPTSPVIATGSTDRTVRLWTAPDGHPIRTLSGHRNTVAALIVSPDGRWITSTSYDGTARLWPLKGDGGPVILRGHGKQVTSAVFLNGGQTLATAGLGGDIFLWSVPSGALIEKIMGHREAVIALGATPDGALVSAGLEGTLVVRSPAEWTRVETYMMGASIPTSFVVSPTGGHLAITRERELVVARLDGLETVARASLPVKGVYAVEYAADGSLVACVAADGICRVWSLSGI